MVPDQKSVTYGISAEDIALYCGVDYRTACRWKAGHTAMPESSKVVLAGDLGHFHPDWTGWLIHRRDGTLVSPEGWEITMNDVMATPLLRQQLALYQSENRALKEALAEVELEEQPTPDQWEVRIA